MLILYIILSVIAFLLILFVLFCVFAKLHLYLECEEDVTCRARILFINMSLFPPKEEKIKLRDFGAKKFKRLYSRQRTKKKKGISEEKAAQPKKEKSIADTFNLINQIAELFITRFSPHIRIKTLRARITVGASDAASVAIKYGIVINLISCFAGILSNAIEKGRELDLSDVTVRADYLSEKSEIKLKLHCYVRVWHILDISGRIIYNNINKSKKKA